MESLRFTTEDGVSLEGELRRPETDPRASAVICHAHPRHGGSKDHPILWAIRNELARSGFVVLSFNFRGTMRSAGTYGGGRSETKDVAAAIGRVRQEGDGPTVVVGWSFGANVALREALDDERVAALALVGLPLDHSLDIPDLPSVSELQPFRRLVLLLAGEQDGYAPEQRVRELAAAFPSAEVAIVPGTDHYLWRREREAAATVARFAERVLEGGVER
jgi:alpha/beta superfamily hydrolase